MNSNLHLNMETNLPTILLVDDDISSLLSLENLLKDRYAVFKASSLDDVFNLLSTQPIQLIVYDISMSGSDGPEFCRQIKSNEDYQHIPLVLLTKKKSLRTKIEVLEIGVDAYMDKKDFCAQYFRAQLNSLLTNRIRLRKYFASSPLVYVENIAYSKADENFLKSMNDVVLENLHKETLDVGLIAQSLNMSRMSLYRRTNELSGLTPHKIINTLRLKKVAELLEEGNFKLYEIADMVGLGSQSNLTRIFQRQYNMSPSAYILSKNVRSKRSSY